ncbi:MAG: TolC family outer membrane protein [Magnetococcales bacterium]|nr:TolC family outer membrane protein [Magnetococcales bacterium]
MNRARLTKQRRLLSLQAQARRRGPVQVGIVLGSVLGMASGPAGAVALVDAVVQALSSRPEIRVALDGTLAAQERVGQAYAGFLPSINLRVAQGSEGTQQLSSQRPYADTVWMNREDRSISLNQNIFDGFRTSNQVASSQAGSRASGWRSVEAAENLGMRAVESYLTVLKGRAQWQEGNNNLAAHQELLEMVHYRLTQGLANQAEVSQARSRLKRAEASLAQAQGSLQVAEAGFQTLFGFEPQGLQEPGDSVAFFNSAEEALALALKQHPALLAAQESVTEAQARERAQNGAYTPAANLVLTASQVRDQSGVEGQTSTKSAMLEVTFNLFSGHRDSHLQREAAFLAKQAEENLAKARLDVTERVASAFRSWQTSLDLVKIYRAQVAELSRVRMAYREQFNLGKRTMLDLLDSESEWFAAQNSLIGELYQGQMDGYRLLFSVGGLLSALQIPLPAGVVPQTVTYAETKKYLLEARTDPTWQTTPQSQPQPKPDKRPGKPLDKPSAKKPAERSPAEPLLEATAQSALLDAAEESATPAECFVPLAVQSVEIDTPLLVKRF